MRWIEGPTLPALRSIGLDSRRIYLITAFYSEAPLRWLSNELDVDELIFAGRLDLTNPAEWLHGSINPAALLWFLTTLRDRSGTRPVRSQLSGPDPAEEGLDRLPPLAPNGCHQPVVDRLMK